MTAHPIPSPERLKAWRACYGLSQARAADLAGVATRSWRRWEEGSRPIPHWLHTILAVYWGAGPCDPILGP